MRFPWARHRPRPAPSARYIDLTMWNDRGDPVMTRIDRPDALHPVDHDHPTEVPVVEVLERKVIDLVDQLAEQHALDAGTPDVADRLVDQWRAGWDARVEQEADGRRRTAARLVAVAVQNAHHAAHDRRGHEDELSVFLSQQGWLRRQVTGHSETSPLHPVGDADRLLQLPPPAELPPARLAGRLRSVPSSPGPAPSGRSGRRRPPSSEVSDGHHG